ncbi:flap endonuclease 1 [Lepeophtheirus salmonis]|uniref:flap endonuclease 1 n=1 Tax=Lepeophtheirus salmonis TaxID=72036 RepID=UPI001AE40042|nr:flap endonuclease 1-like [Lepeophtheirus salmonis]
MLTFSIIFGALKLIHAPIKKYPNFLIGARNMGILGLSKLIADVSPEAVKENEIKNYFGRKVAIDASMSLYQFLIAVRGDGGNQLTNADGETTSHLMGTFYRTIRMVENGIKPVYVFDGKPPNLKSGELEKRSEKRSEAEAALEKAKELGDTSEIDKQARRLVKVSSVHVEEAKTLLKLMGVPTVSAPCEAEAQCAELSKGGLVYGVGTEDMDSLTFGTTILLRHLTFSEARKMPIKEFHIDKVLEGFGLTQEEFIDLCILLGCDYCDKIRGIGPKSAFKLMSEHKSIENLIKNLDSKKYSIPENWMFAEARKLFVHPEVTPCSEINLKWEKPDEEGLIKFMCEEKGFAEDRIRNGAKKLLKARQGSTQGRLDGFFKVISTPSPKRKSNEPLSKTTSNKKAKTNGKKGTYKK